MKYLSFLLGWLVWHIKAAIWYVNMSLKIFFGISLDNRHNHGEARDDLADVTYPEPKAYQRHLG